MLPQSMMEFWEWVLAIMLGIVGGITKLLSLNKGKKKLSLESILSQAFGSGFVGLCAYLACKAFEVESGAMYSLASGLFGFMGTFALEGLVSIFEGKTGITITEKDKEEKK